MIVAAGKACRTRLAQAAPGCKHRRVASRGGPLLNEALTHAYTFSQMLQDWSNFFSALAQVSGGLVGLVFVALTVNAKALGAKGDPLLGALARQTFGDFVSLLLISLVMLVPTTGGLNTGVTLFAFVALDMVRLGFNLLRLRRNLGAQAGRGEIWQRFALSGTAHGLLAAAGVLLFDGDVRPQTTGALLFGGIIMMLLSACRSAWLLVGHELE